MMISGAFGFETESYADSKESSFEIAPRFSYFVSDNIAVGAKIGFMSMKGDNGTVDTLDAQTLSLGAFGRYYMTPASKFSVFAELGFDYNSTDDKLADAKLNGFDLGVGPGVSYFLSDAFAIEASWGMLNYATEKGDWTGAESTDTFGLGLDMRDLTFGLAYKF